MDPFGKFSRIATSAKKAAPVRLTPLALAFAQQKPLVSSTNQFDIAVLPRQAGKTTAAVLRAVYVAEQLHARLVTYITKTRRNAKRIFWRPLLEWASKAGHNVSKNANHSDLTLRIDHSDGSYCLIELMGAHDIDKILDLRGTQYDLVIIDEAGFIRTAVLEMLLSEVIRPGIRIRRGSILLIGTPGPLKLGPFYEAFVSGGWQSFRWTAYDNPATPLGSIEEEVKALGLKETDPRYIREYLAQWSDGRDDLMVWQYEPGRDDPDITLPSSANDNGFEAWRYSWGVDIASNKDNDALVVLGWDTKDDRRRLYQVDEWEGPGSEIVDDFEKVLQEKKERWKPSRLIGDISGHGAQKIVKTFAAKLRLKLDAKPTDVEGTVRLMNTDFRTERFKVLRGGKLGDDMRREFWRVVEKSDGSVKREIDKATHSDLTAAARYAYMAAKAHRSEADPVVPNDEEAKNERMIQEYLARVDAQKKKRRWA